MRLERLTANKIKIFLSSDDLFERGLSKEDIWKDSIKWHQLFHDMLEEASEEFDVEFEGSVAVEIFSLQAQGMIMIITVDETAEDEEVLYDGFVEMQVRVEGNDDLLFIFNTIEDVIALSKRLNCMGIQGGNLFSLDGCYFMHMQKINAADLERTASILSEYGDASITSPHWLMEYGNLIIKDNAVETLLHFFK